MQAYLLYLVVFLSTTAWNGLEWNGMEWSLEMYPYPKGLSKGFPNSEQFVPPRLKSAKLISRKPMTLQCCVMNERNNHLKRSLTMKTI